MDLTVWLKSPKREYALIAALSAAFAIDSLFRIQGIIFAIAIVAAFQPIAAAVRAALRRRITIDTFNVFALIMAFASTDERSAGFITLMLCFAAILQSYTQGKTERALEKLLELKPDKATVETGGVLKEIPASDVKEGDIVLIESGGRVPVDGKVIFGVTYVNEAPVTGESVPVHKVVGDSVFSGTLVESGALKIEATHVGADSTIERMVRLMKEAAVNKSQPERLADRFAAIFLPIVGVIGIIGYVVTRDMSVVASIFLVACADDMAVAIPLAITATLGAAASRGILIKGGERIEMLSKLDTLVLDKTGTVTYGNLEAENVELEKGIDEGRLWPAVAAAEKFAEHPVGKAVYRFAAAKLKTVDDPDSFESIAGEGVVARHKGVEVIVGKPEFLGDRRMAYPVPKSGEDAWVYIAIDGRYACRMQVHDRPRPEAGASLWRLKKLGIKRIIMFTGDRPETAARVAAALGIDRYQAGMEPEDKIREFAKLAKQHPEIGMVGDGVNDAPVLSGAGVGIAMGGGTEAAIEAADVVIMNDDLSRLPATVELSRHTMRIIRSDIVIWAVSNLFGFVLVFAGIAGPALAAAYNFLADFIPLINSARLFRLIKRHPRANMRKHEKTPSLHR